MNPNNQPSKQGQLGLIYISVTLGLILIAFTYFYSVFQPRLYQESQNQAAFLINSISQDLLQRRTLEDAFLLQKEIGKLLLYTDEHFQTPYIKGIKIEFNPDLFPHHSRPLQRGDSFCKHCFEVNKQVFCNSTNELIANIRFMVNPVNYERMIDDITQKFFIFIVLLVLLLTIIWFNTRRLLLVNIKNQSGLISANEYNKKLINTLQDWLFVIDEKGMIFNTNETALFNINTSFKEVNKCYIQQFVTPERSSLFLMSLIKRSAAQNSNSLVEVKIKIKNGVEHHGLLSCTRFIEPNQTEFIQYLVVIKDVQALKIVESKLAYQAQMAHASRLKSLGEMAAGIAHEINQPLAVIRLGAEGIKQSLERKDNCIFECEIAQDMIDQVDRAAQIIDNMRVFSRRNPSKKQRLAIHHPLNNALTFFREPFRVQGIELIEIIDCTSPKVDIESQKLEQVIINLLTNARQALETDARHNPKIIVELKCDQEHVILSITDNGCGMDETTRQHCMEPFFTTKEVGEGTGLGLSIVDNILLELDIKLTIKSQVANGSTFTLYIPHKLTDNDDV